VAQAILFTLRTEGPVRFCTSNALNVPTRRNPTPLQQEDRLKPVPSKITLPPNSDHAASADRTALIALAHDAAAQCALDPALVCAIVEQESAWDSHAIRYEPAFRTRYVAPLGLPPTEEVARSISWGLMQVMGQVAGEHGFAGKSLAELCEPAAGLTIGCAAFAAKLRVSADDVQRALTLWNGGANAAYATQVLGRLAKYR
jgi:soluble lytic murein transglycosylase-like protein